MSATTPITTDLPVLSQSINIDIESIAPTQGFGASSYDVANMTITAVVQSPADQDYRLVLQGDLEAGTSAFARVISASKAHFKDVRPFKRIIKKDAEIIRPVLDKAGEVLDTTTNEKRQLEQHAQRYKVSDIRVPAGQQTIRIHASQLLLPVDGDPRHYRFTMYAPQLSLAPVSNVRLGATVVLPLDFAGTVEQVLVEPMPNQPTPNLVAGGDAPVAVGGQQAYGWAFQADPKITLAYRYA
ncbi:hypothetical protein [uncultured Pseudokineococcus sp.]|uniref:hypothetical protein n=1 Tax=uncultured Pseudokineococcus sp. TaxID=1642928 RepID=UPI0026050277|nr:hypothetical protein [uncultured Pseudokineococcus sp.]